MKQQAEDSYEPQEPDQHISVNELSPEIPYDFDGIDGFALKNNIRDQEYLQHSSLWSRQNLGKYINFNRNNLKPIKEDTKENQLPAYCTPPNPCPVGYTSKFFCSKIYFFKLSNLK